MGNGRDAEALRTLSVDRLRDFGSYPVFPEAVPDASLDDGKYGVRFARTPAELAEVQRLRFEVFNLELGEGLDESYETGLDEDRFDPVCHHLIVTDRRSERIVGTYRMLTSAMAEAHEGFYSAGEFDLDALPPSVIGDAIEIGRACVATEYRNRHVLFLLEGSGPVPDPQPQALPVRLLLADQPGPARGQPRDGAPREQRSGPPHTAIEDAAGLGMRSPSRRRSGRRARGQAAQAVPALPALRRTRL